MSPSNKGPDETDGVWKDRLGHLQTRDRVKVCFGTIFWWHRLLQSSIEASGWPNGLRRRFGSQKTKKQKQNKKKQHKNKKQKKKKTTKKKKKKKKWAWIRLKAEFLSWLYSVSVHRSFNCYTSIVSIWFKKKMLKWCIIWSHHHHQYLNNSCIKLDDAARMNRLKFAGSRSM